MTANHLLTAAAAVATAMLVFAPTPSEDLPAYHGIVLCHMI
jgi:hypothetical protein